jgi:hypothetical protein
VKRIRPFLLAFAVLVAIPLVSQATIQQQRAQEQVSISINVTANPLGFVPNAQPAANVAAGAGSIAPSGIIARFTAGDEVNPGAFHAENLHLAGDGSLLAQNQGSVLIQAKVSPNPNATLLYPNNCGGQFPQTGQCGVVSLPGQEAGTTVQYPCIYSVTVDTTQTSWTLQSGLFTDWFNGGLSFQGKNVAYSGYITAPGPTATPFIVFSDGQTWTSFAVNGGMKTYCVNLTVTIPIATTAGTYSSNAVYTLFY